MEPETICAASVPSMDSFYCCAAVFRGQMRLGVSPIWQHHKAVRIASCNQKQVHHVKPISTNLELLLTLKVY